MEFSLNIFIISNTVDSTASLFIVELPKCLTGQLYISNTEPTFKTKFKDLIVNFNDTQTYQIFFYFTPYYIIDVSETLILIQEPNTELIISDIMDGQYLLYYIQSKVYPEQEQYANSFQCWLDFHVCYYTCAYCNIEGNQADHECTQCSDIHFIKKLNSNSYFNCYTEQECKNLDDYFLCDNTCITECPSAFEYTSNK